MFHVKSTVLTAALVGGGALSVASAQGCYPAYVGGASYTSGSQVSASQTTETSTTTTCSPAGTSTCPASGQLTTTTTTTTTRNYQCVSNANSAFCGTSGYEPGTNGIAWTELGTCSGTAPAAATTPGPTPALWSGTGCPAAYSTGADYSAGSTVTVPGTSFNTVYSCNAAPADAWCGQAGYEPGDSIHWAQAWTALGSCTGTIAPTSSPVYTTIADAGGCPSAYSGSATYEEGDKISKDGLVYQCKSFPSSLHCSQEGYEPGECIAPGTCYWQQAWAVTGYCEGTIAPTTSPNYVTLVDMGGCPGAWASQTYEEGDRVSDGTLVYECKAWPFSGHCGQAGYEPNVDPATPGAWKDAWTVKGFCEGTIAPTTAPNFNPATSVGACPDEWEAGSNVKYEEGDMVSVKVSETPLRQVVFKCKAWPFSGFCGQLSPTVFGGDQGWTPAGSCDGSMGPTAAPSFDSLSDTGLGCPEAWSGSKTDYEAGDQVSYAVSTSPERKIVYECKAWPNTGYCNQGAGFEPGTTYSNMAWDLKGYCDGTVAPTSSPTPYAGTCTYIKCLDGQTCAKGTASNGIAGSSACSCSATDTSCTSGTQTVCNVADVEPYSSSASYATGDVVRVGSTQFRCREWPNEGWCGNSAYEPTLDADETLWKLAWTKLTEKCESNCLEATLAAFGTNGTGTEAGTVTVCFDGLWGNLVLAGTDFEPSISDGGIHIHGGTDCTNTTTQGGHDFFVASSGTGVNGDGDPWFNTPTSIAPTGTSYSTTAAGVASADFLFNSGYGIGPTNGKVVVVHRSKAAGYKRVACGVLAPAP